jgi:hypothetical protein
MARDTKASIKKNKVSTPRSRLASYNVHKGLIYIFLENNYKSYDSLPIIP